LKFTALLHHVTVDLLRDSYGSLKKQAAPGVDGVTWEKYGQDLEARLTGLHGRIHSGAYRAQPSRRVRGPEGAPKADGRQRPLGIAALEDKIVQYAVGTVLNPIWEEDFVGFWLGGAGCAVGRDSAQEGELGARSGHACVRSAFVPFSTISGMHGW
jgi:retron-type reverse transcriptase